MAGFTEELATIGVTGFKARPLATLQYLHFMPGAHEIIGRCHTNHARSQHQNLHRRRPKSICIGAMVIQP